MELVWVEYAILIPKSSKKKRLTAASLFRFTALAPELQALAVFSHMWVASSRVALFVVLEKNK